MKMLDLEDKVQKKNAVIEAGFITTASLLIEDLKYIVYYSKYNKLA